MRGDISPEKDLFEQFKTSVLNVDPVSFIENNLTIDGEKFDISAGYKPFADIYRYICLKAVDDESMPVLLVKGRQVGATTMAAALEAYFMGCGLYGNGHRSPMRIMHLFPTLSLAAAYTKDKLTPIIQQSRPTNILKSNGLPKSFMEAKMDTSSPANDNQHFKKFVGGNQIWIESTGLTGDRIRGRQICLETELPTPDRGFIKLKDLKEGDKLFDENGEICNVTKLHPIQESPESYRVTFDDGTQIDACAEHLWGTYVDDIYLIKNTKDILNLLNKKHYVPDFKSTDKLLSLNVNLPEDGLKRFIKYINPIDSKPMRCITVDSPSHLYLVTRSFIPTHNTVDCLFFDECFPYNQLINTDCGKIKIGKLYDNFSNGKDLPNVMSYNEITKNFEYKKILNAWKRDKRKLIMVKLNNRKIKCTPNHPFLTTNGWVKAQDLVLGNLVLTSLSNFDYINSDTVHVESVTHLDEVDYVYDIEVEDNHNFIASFTSDIKDNSGVIVHNCQDMSAQAIGAADKIATQAKYGEIGQGVKVLFGTPKQKGGAYWNMWEKSSQQYFHLHCESCEKLFPLYRPDVNWEEIWLYGFIVKCTHCGCEQDKRKAAAKGKWVAINKDPEGTPLDERRVKMHGFHINQLYIPKFSKEKIIAQKPGNSPTNTERIYMNEVLGEFYDGEGGTISKEEIIANCLEDRGFSAQISPSDNFRVYAGFDWGQKANMDMMAGKRQGQSYSCAVILTAQGPELFSVEFATKLTRNDPQEKKDIVEEMFRRYSVGLSVGDVGDAGDLTHTLQSTYGDVFLGSRAASSVNGYIKFRDDVFPKEIVFDRDYYISEMFDLLRRGCIKFPKRSWDKVEWLINHCCSMDVKITTARNGEPKRHFIKGQTPNDGFMALMNAYLAWKFDVTQRFNIKSPGNRQHEVAQNKGSGLAPLLGYVPNW